jgi:hypothetical protein
LIDLAEKYPDLLVLAYADNVFLTGPLSVALPAAAAFKVDVGPTGLLLNDQESSLLCTDRQLERLPAAFVVQGDTVRGLGLTLAVCRTGIVALGCPVGSETFARGVASSFMQDVSSELEALASFPHRHHCAKIVTFGTNARFTYHSRCWPVSLLVAAAEEMDALVNSFLPCLLPFLALPANRSQSDGHVRAIRQIRLNLTYGGWGLRCHADHLPAAVYSSLAEFLLWLRQRTCEVGSLSKWLGVDLVTPGSVDILAGHNVLLQDLHWALDTLQNRWSFRVADRPTSTLPADAPRDLPRRQASRTPSASVPSISGILRWDSALRFPRQHHVSHYISAHCWARLRSEFPAGSRDYFRLGAVCRYEVPAFSRSSALSFASPSSTKSLGVTPRALMSLTCPHYLDPADWLDLEALFLGLPVPFLQDSLPAAPLASDALGDRQFSSSTHAGHTRKQSHDQLAVLLADFARRAGLSGVQTAFSRIPVAGRLDSPGARGDIFLPSGLCPSDPGRPFVLDIRLGHIFARTGNPRPPVLSAISREKNRRYRDPYHARNIVFAPLPVTTFLSVGPEVCHLLYRLASVIAAQPGPADIDCNVLFSRLLKEFQFGVALASLLRLRGVDGFIPAPPAPCSSAGSS